MNLREYKKQQKQENTITFQEAYKQQLDKLLKDTLIPFVTLRQCKELTPERKLVGIDGNGNKIMFEETASSLRRRHYKKINKPATYNLIVTDGTKAELITKDYLKTHRIEFNPDYDMQLLVDFLNSGSHKLNKEKRQSYYMCLTPTEHAIVQEFIKKMRKLKDENY